MEASASLEHAQTIFEGVLILMESISMLMFPFTVTFLLGAPSSSSSSSSLH